MLYWIYILILVYLTVIVLIEFFSAEGWIKKITYAMLLLPFILRILQIK
ncbi:MAG: hypothetical protein GXO77_12020 [Calditrichaeota bacterium]|nr:hypothetical protein [Calditrichota bacterium]